jgi:hypothetical protein
MNREYGVYDYVHGWAFTEHLYVMCMGDGLHVTGVVWIVRLEVLVFYGVTSTWYGELFVKTL